MIATARSESSLNRQIADEGGISPTVVLVKVLQITSTPINVILSLSPFLRSRRFLSHQASEETDESMNIATRLW